MKKTVTSIEIHKEQITVLQVQKKGKAFVITYGDTQWAATSQEKDVVDCLRGMVARLPAESDETVLLVPRQSVILRQMSFPTTDDDELHDMAGLQLVNKIPFPVEDIVYQLLMLEKGTDESRVLVTAILKEESQKYCRIMMQAGIDHGKVSLSSLGIMNWLDSQERFHRVFRRIPTMVIDLEEQYTEVCFCHDGKLYYSRHIFCGAKTIAPEKADEVTHQVKVSLDTYHRDRLGPPIEKVLILSARQEGNILREHLDQLFDYPVNVLNPVSVIPDLKCSQETVLRLQNSQSVVSGLGMALQDRQPLMNLAPVEIHDARRQKEQRNRLVKFLILVLTAVVLGIAGQWIDLIDRKAELSGIQERIAGIAQEYVSADETIKFVRAYDNKIAGRHFIPDVIRQLADITPEEVSLKSLSLAENDSLTLQGFAKSNTDINDLQAQMIQSPIFKDVDLRFATKRRFLNMNVMDFEIAAKLQSSGKDVLWADF